MTQSKEWQAGYEAGQAEMRDEVQQLKAALHKATSLLRLTQATQTVDREGVKCGPDEFRPETYDLIRKFAAAEGFRVNDYALGVFAGIIAILKEADGIELSARH